MSGESKDYRGGEIEVSAQRPRGLPFLKPLYGLPPYQYTDDIVLIISYESEQVLWNFQTPQTTPSHASSL